MHQVEVRCDHVNPKSSYQRSIVHGGRRYTEKTHKEDVVSLFELSNAVE